MKLTRASDAHGRLANDPAKIPPAGWKDIGYRLKDTIGESHLSIVSAGVAFFLLLGIVPALAAALMIYGYIADPEDFRTLFASAVIPADVQQILVDQLQAIADPEGKAGVAAVISIVLALWAGSKGTKGLMTAINIAYREHEKRGLVRKFITAYLLTVVIILLGLLALFLVALLPAIIQFLPLSRVEEKLAAWLRWPVLLLGNITVLAVLYRFAPSRRKPQWKWVSVGSLIATLGWLLASALFSLYVSNFGNFNETYGSLGAVVIFLIWLYLTAFLILLGAAINAEIEHQTAQDTTTGKPKPMGKRHAWVADHLGRESG
jgi:membrane protein